MSFRKDLAKPRCIIFNCLLFIVAFTFGMVSNPYLRSFPESFQLSETYFTRTNSSETSFAQKNSSETLVADQEDHISETSMTRKNISETCLNVSAVTTVPEPVSGAMHNMTEEELLWRASFAPKINHAPSNRVPKIAFLFLTRGNLPLAPFWDEFLKGHDGLYSIYMHPDPAYSGSVQKSSAFFGRRIPSRPVSWGNINMIEAERRLLANALLDSSNERFVLLSESCIPLYNFTTIYTYLVNSNMSYVGSGYDMGPGGIGRYNPAMAPYITVQQWYKASQWIEVNRALAVEIVSDETYFPLFQKFCIIRWNPPCISDEHYVPTFIVASSWRNNANRSVTYTDWSQGKPHPASFGKDDVKLELFDKIRNSENCTYNGMNTRVCALFARKFLPDALDPLMNLGSELKIFG